MVVAGSENTQAMRFVAYLDVTRTVDSSPLKKLCLVSVAREARHTNQAKFFNRAGVRTSLLGKAFGVR